METFNRLAILSRESGDKGHLLTQTQFLSDREVIMLSTLIYEMFKHRSDRMTV